MGKKYKYKYMTVSIPGDCLPGVEDKEEALKQMGNIAIDEAREQMKTWAIPAVWTAKRISGQPGESHEVIFKVCRKSGAVH